MILHTLYRLREAGRPMYVIVPKSRRVGVSTFISALGFAQGLAMSNGRILTVAHRSDSASALFETPQQFAQNFPVPLPPPTQKRIFFPHRGGNSVMRFATAGEIAGGRGLGLSCLHFSEAAHVDDPESFTALLPAVSNDPSSISIIESSPNGKEGKGAEFYERCEKARRKRSNYELVFLSWLDDPGCVRDADEALDAPATDLEREVMRDFGATLAQIAWMRWCFETQCNGIESRLMSEYPYCYDVAFTSSAYPAFEHEEIRRAEKMVRPPKNRGYFELDGNSSRFIAKSSGNWLIWQNPIEGHEYFMGCDAARGKLTEDSEAIGDFAAITIYDGSTGEQVARFADRISPDTFARMIYCAAVFYNNALVNIELTGGWGRWAQKELRDVYYYPYLYGWKGKDDKVRPKGRPAVSGWETTQVSRDRMYNAFRAKLRAHEITVRDEELLHQMRGAEMFYGRWEVEKGHDDILVSAFLAVVAMSDYPVVRTDNTSKFDEENEQEAGIQFVRNDPQQAVTDHWNEIQSVISGGSNFGEWEQ
ncbi:MAG TPA: hypothetical protein VGT24_01595 [Candidatus Acidoferrales bacterium]|nr:hypothetical protein [Candidatus Acidoferrales bacterium]